MKKVNIEQHGGEGKSGTDGETTSACGTCQIEAIWLPRVANFTFVFVLVSPAGFFGSEQN